MVREHTHLKGTCSMVLGKCVTVKQETLTQNQTASTITLKHTRCNFGHSNELRYYSQCSYFMENI